VYLPKFSLGAGRFGGFGSAQRMWVSSNGREATTDKTPIAGEEVSNLLYDWISLAALTAFKVTVFEEGNRSINRPKRVIVLGDRGLKANYFSSTHHYSFPLQASSVAMIDIAFRRISQERTLTAAKSSESAGSPKLLQASGLGTMRTSSRVNNPFNSFRLS